MAFQSLAAPLTFKRYACVLASILLSTIHSTLHTINSRDKQLESPLPIHLSKDHSKFALRFWDELPMELFQPLGVATSDEPLTPVPLRKIYWRAWSWKLIVKSSVRMRTTHAGEDDHEDPADGERPTEWVVAEIRHVTDKQIVTSAQSALHNLVASLFLQDSLEDPNSHPMAVAVLSKVSLADGKTCSPQEVCSPLAAIQYGIQLSAFKEAQILFAFASVQHLFLEKVLTIFGCMRDNISKATAASYLDHPTPNIQYKNSAKTIIIYKGLQRDLKVFRTYCTLIQPACLSSLERLLGDIPWQDLWDIAIKGWSGHGLCKDISCEDVGYSVFDDP